MARIENSPEMWIRKDGAFPSIVSPSIFYTAQGIVRARSHRFTNEELIARLRTLYQERGYLSGLIIDETDGMPSTSVYAHRFGSLIRAYEIVGFSPDRDYRYLEINQFLRRLHPEVVSSVEQQILDLGAKVSCDPTTDLLNINHEFTASVVLARSRELDSGKLRWKMRFDTSLLPDITIGVRLNHSNSGPLDYYLLPKLDFIRTNINFAERNSSELESYRFDDLSYLYAMAERAKICQVA